MARNRSERLSRCPEAIAYAEACETWLRDGTFPSPTLGQLWGRLPLPLRDALRQTMPAVSDGEGNKRWRAASAKHIRKTYGS